MKKFLLTLSLIVTILMTPLCYARPLSSQQSQFINFMLPKIEKANTNIMRKRQRLLNLYQDYRANRNLSPNDTTWLTALASSYKVKTPVNNEYQWQQLLAKVDIMPPALVLAQAINESAWGRSRFAKEGNNYFGQWCSAPGCGLIPKKRKPGSPWQVQKFNNAYDSVVAYLKNLNTNRAYDELRSIRFELREAGKPLNPDVIAEGLATYSQRKEQYVTIMQNIINSFALAQIVENHQA